LAAFFVAFFFVATDLTSSRDSVCTDGLSLQTQTLVPAYFFFLAAFFVAFFFVATDLTSSRDQM